MSFQPVSDRLINSVIITSIALINTHRVYLTFAYYTRWTQNDRYLSPPLYIKIDNVEEVNSLATELLKENLPQPPPTTPTKIRKLPSPSSMVTPKAVRSSFAKSSEAAESKKSSSPKETVKVAGETRKNLNLANIKVVADEKIAKSPSPEYPVNPRLKSPDKSSPNTPRKASPKNIRLPKLAPSPTPPETIPISETHSKISLPKLIEPSKHLNSVAH